MSNSKITHLVEGAIMIALATILSYIRIFRLPWGGSITLLSMLPIIIFSIKHGLKRGLLVSLIFSLIQLGQGIIDGVFASPVLTVGMIVACIFIDYIGAYTVIGIAGIFRNKGKTGWLSGAAIAILARFSFHFLSGVVIWKSFGELWEGFSTDNTYLYSLLYNGAYMLPEMIFTVFGAAILFSAPQFKKLITPKISD